MIALMQRLSIVCSVGVLLFSLACTIPASKDFGTPNTTTPGEVPFELAPPNDAAIIVPAQINGRRPYKFVPAAGATLTGSDQKLIDELKLPEWRGQFGGGVLKPVEGAVKLVD